MSSNDIDRRVHDRLRDAIDPRVPGPEVADRVMSAVAREAFEDRLRITAGARIGRGLGTLLVASLVVLLVGGALGISLALRGRSLPAPAGHTNPPLPVPTPTLTPPSPSPLPSPSSSPIPGLAACRSSDLTAHFADPNGAAGTAGGEIVLQNMSHAACNLEGYTNLQGFNQGRVTQLGVTHDFSGIFSNNGIPPKPQLVTLQPGHDAYVAFVYGDVQTSARACPSFTTLLVTPPGQTRAIRMTAPAYTVFVFCSSVVAAIWVDEAPVSSIELFAGQ